MLTSDLRTLLDGTLWLAEPIRLRQYAVQMLRANDWPNARQVAKERRKRLEVSRQVAAKAVRAQKGKVAVIPCHGPVEQRLTCLGMMTGGCSTEEISAALDACINDKSIDCVVLHCDSPGGSSYGVPELSDKIYSARGKKNLYAISDSLCASAMFWIATSCEHMTCTPGGDCGSVGAYMVHVDESKACEEAGIAVTLISAGKYKTEGNPYEPLDKEAAGYIKEQVDWISDKFHDALKRNRNVGLDVVRRNFGQGRCLNADDSLKNGLVDKLMSFEELMRKLTGGAGGGSEAKLASMEMLRLRHQQRQRETELLLSSLRA